MGGTVSKFLLPATLRAYVVKGYHHDRTLFPIEAAGGDLDRD
jgi:hypothetical protein